MINTKLKGADIMKHTKIAFSATNVTSLMEMLNSESQTILSLINSSIWPKSLSNGRTAINKVLLEDSKSQGNSKASTTNNKTIEVECKVVEAEEAFRAEV